MGLCGQNNFACDGARGNRLAPLPSSISARMLAPLFWQTYSGEGGNIAHNTCYWLSAGGLCQTYLPRANNCFRWRAWQPTSHAPGGAGLLENRANLLRGGAGCAGAALNDGARAAIGGAILTSIRGARELSHTISHHTPPSTGALITHPHTSSL